jgi:hypothetical protein
MILDDAGHDGLPMSKVSLIYVDIYIRCLDDDSIDS